MGKTRFAEHTRRFAGVVRQPAVYAAELSGGVLKVGATGNARYRLMSLQSDVKRTHGLELHRFHVVPTATARAAYEIETALVNCLWHYAAPLPGHREFFTGITFDRACELFSFLAAPRSCENDPDEHPCTWNSPQSACVSVAWSDGHFVGPALIVDFYAAISPQASHSAITPICSPSQT